MKQLSYFWLCSFVMQVLSLLDAIEILQIAQSSHWKEKMSSWMDLTPLEGAPLQNVLWLQ